MTPDLEHAAELRNLHRWIRVQVELSDRERNAIERAIELLEREAKANPSRVTTWPISNSFDPRAKR